jgi:hypothetical protein
MLRVGRGRWCRGRERCGVTKDVLEARIALLEEMLAAAQKTAYSTAFEFCRDRNDIDMATAGFLVASDVFAQWKAIENGTVTREPPMAMPQDVEGVEG